jgi:hypothetical protein
MDTYEPNKNAVVKEAPVSLESGVIDLESGVIEDTAPRLGRGELDVIKIQEQNSVLRKLREAEVWMDRKLKVEGMGAERIPDSQRRPPHVVNVRELRLSS